MLVSQVAVGPNPAMTLVDRRGACGRRRSPAPGVLSVQRDSYTPATVARAAKGTWSVRLSAPRSTTVDLRVVSSSASAGI